MTGTTLTTLMTALNVGSAELARESGVTKQAIGFNRKSKKLLPQTESRLVAALATIARRRGEARERAQTEHLLELAQV